MLNTTPGFHTPLDNFVKLRLWQLPYERVVFLDADTIVVRNIDRLFHYLIGNAQLAAEVIMSWQPETAGILLQRKRDLRKMCHDSSRQHIHRLSNDVSNALASSSAHLDLISDMRWINTQVSSIAYDVLPETEDSGDENAEKLIVHPE